MSDTTPDPITPDETPAAPTPIPRGRGGRTAAVEAPETPAETPAPVEAPAAPEDGDDGVTPAEFAAVLDAYVPDPRPAALVAAANYYAGANVPDQLIIDKARRFERYLLEPRGDDWKPISKKARKAAEAEGVQA
ncbi:hypothetical protein [Herbiconiux flava]|uniref:Uncharacterized protein n=1 Tax=Herbiconiux flava TaxID=881268 RepID=A0A852STP2_9MICO|nr:hypothetical protein [Herbiconiux flava]NYD72299.1 hypothetical protein [Herbiconiux flava]GLK17738.1 hypothetical protein GCM10017602_22200 [Herbiconiux flava]